MESDADVLWNKYQLNHQHARDIAIERHNLLKYDQLDAVLQKHECTIKRTVLERGGHVVQRGDKLTNTAINVPKCPHFVIAAPASSVCASPMVHSLVPTQPRWIRSQVLF